MDIWQASREGQLSRVKEIVEADSGGFKAVNLCDKDGISPLHWASLNNRFAVVKYLLDCGAKVDAVGGDQSGPPLHWAACKGHTGVMGILFRYGATWDQTDRHGYNSLHIAAQNGHELACLLILAQDAPVDTLDSFGRTPLLWSAYKNHPDCVEVLLKSGADPNIYDNNSRSPLHWAVIKGNGICASRILGSGQVSADMRDMDGKSVEDWAREKKNDWYFKLLRNVKNYNTQVTKTAIKLLN